jgi:hypothetical protein
MAIVEMDGATVDGTNPDVVDPVITAMIDMGYTLSDLSDVSDTDLSSIPDSRYNELVDRAELRLLQNIAGNQVCVDITVGPRKESLSQLSQYVEKQIDRVSERNKKLYGDDLMPLTAGKISLGYQEPQP